MVPIPREGGQVNARNCIMQEETVSWLNPKPFQQLLVHQPIKLGGLGIRSLIETSPAAFVGGVEMSLPHFTGQDGICTNLVDVIGKIEGGSRWDAFLASGSRTATEISSAWTAVRTECSSFLDKELDGTLAKEVESAGEESVDGSTRRKAVQQRESLRHARPVTAYQNLDKLSVAWLLALPGSMNRLSSAVFAESLCAHMCLPSPAVMGSGWVGKSIGRRGAEDNCYGSKPSFYSLTL